MNNINDMFSKNEIKNKLKDFKEGQDYSVSPTDEPNIKTYNFHNDKLRSVFRNDRVPVRITQEAYDGKDYTYRGHFEQGKDYYYSHQTWEGQNVPADKDGWRPIEKSISKSGNGDYSNWSMSFRPLINSSEPKRIEPSFNNNEIEMHQKYLTEFQEKKHFYEMRLIEEKNGSKSCCEKHRQEFLKSPKRDELILDIKRSIEEFETKIQYEKDWLAKNANGYGNNHSDLQKENQQLRQELSEVKKQLAQVLEELKKLKNNSNNKDSEKLEQQIVQNEKLIKDSENISVAEVQEQVNKSQALMKEFNVGVSSTKDDKGNGSLPYVIGGSAILASVGIIGYFLLKKNKQK